MQGRPTGAHRAADPPRWTLTGPPGAPVPQWSGATGPQASGPPSGAVPQWSSQGAQTPEWVRGPQWAQQAPPPQAAPPQGWAAPQEPYQAPWGLTAATSADGGRREARSAATRQMAIGGVIALIGIVVTVGTYAAASDGGHYFVAYGPAIIGVITFVKGLVGYLRA